MNASELKANVDTIVVVMFENRSFDNVLGHLAHPSFDHRTDIEGIVDETDPNWINDTSQGLAAAPFFTDDFVINTDLPHGSVAVATQLAWSTVRVAFGMTGFVRAFEAEFHTTIANSPVMALLRPSGVPVTHALAAQYTVCDNWFACVPTSTAPNRMMSMCGDTPITETKVELPDTDTVYEYLSRNNVRWRVYSAGLPFFALMPKMAPTILGPQFRDIDALATDLANEPASTWPQVIFIEPDYFDSPARTRPPCDNHAPLSMAPGEAFLKQVYDTLTSNSARWARTAMFVTYDEHGGFWDHVAPARIPYANPSGTKFDSTGPRIPVIACGPFARKAGVSKLQLDNTSILRLFADRFGTGSYSASVDARAERGVHSAAEVLTATANNGAVVSLSNVIVPPQPTPGGVPSALGALFVQAGKRMVAVDSVTALHKFPALKSL